MTRRPATFTEANAWVHLPPEWFGRHFRYIASVWQTEGSKVWVETDTSRGPDDGELAWWERAERQIGEPVLPCGCQVRVRYLPHARETVCAFSNPAISFHSKLRISSRLMLSAGAVSRLDGALCIHPHDEETIVQQLERALTESR